MVEKTLERMEVQRGFIQLPSKSRKDLFGDMLLPSTTSLNASPAKIDKYGRLWSSFLKNKFHVGECIEISRSEGGFFIKSIQKKDVATLETQIAEMTPIQTEVERSIKDMAYFKTDSVSIINDDFLTTKAIRESRIDLTVTSPPYNVDVQYGNYKDDIPYGEYLTFTKKWLAKCYMLTKDDGRLCLNIPLDKNKGGQQSVCADITSIAKEVGWKYHATIIWNEQNISRRTAWGSWLSASAPFVIAPVETIVVLYKMRWQKTSGSQKSDITRAEFIEWTNGVWNFNGESRSKIGHPAPFPLELPKRCIKLFSFVGDTILDPFLGSGTTLIACLENDRAGVGVEINEDYCKLAVKRLKAHGIFQKKLLEIT